MRIHTKGAIILPRRARGQHRETALKKRSIMRFLTDSNGRSEPARGLQGKKKQRSSFCVSASNRSRLFYPDRLGTNIGKKTQFLQNRHCVVCAGHHAAGAGRGAGGAVAVHLLANRLDRFPLDSP